MNEDPLDNPLWHSLTTRHSHIALGEGSARRYPPDTAPFAAVPGATPEASRHLEMLVNTGEMVAILNVIPDLDGGWAQVRQIDIHQYVWPERKTGTPWKEAVKLTEDDIPQMLELTAKVYPHYFKPGTARLGDYFGIIEDGRLAAMGGIRMAMPGYQELSAICTHPDYRGRGYASRLSSHLIHHIMSQDEVPFLHTESDNHAAQHVYEKLGFELRKVLPFRVMQRL